MFKYLRILLLCLVVSLFLSTSATPTPARPPTLLLGKPFKPTNPFLSPRILTKGHPPLNVLHNGPYFINHYIYCDNLDQHTLLDQIRGGTLNSEKQFELLSNFHKDKFNSLSGFDTPLGLGASSGLHHFGPTATFTGDKEVHVLHLPKDKLHDFDDIKLHLDLANAYKSPNIDLDLNKNLDNFEVNLASIKPPKLDASLLSTSSAIDEVVRPLIKGHISVDRPTKYNINLDQLTQIITESKDTNEVSHLGHGSNEILDTPHFENQPLDSDSGKSSYDTPHALDSYGNPVKPTPFQKNSHSLPSAPNLAHLVPNENSGLLKNSGLQSSNEEFYLPEEYFNQLNEIHELNRKRRQGLRGNEAKRDDDRHRNHRYE